MESLNIEIELLNTDKELNAVDEARYNQYLDVAIQGLKAVATPGFSELLKAEGLTHHPEFIKTFHKYKGITPKQFMKAEF